MKCRGGAGEEDEGEDEMIMVISFFFFQQRPHESLFVLPHILLTSSDMLI